MWAVRYQSAVNRPGLRRSGVCAGPCWRSDRPAAPAGGAVQAAGPAPSAGVIRNPAAERLFDTGGASATAGALNLDRHWRNARTIASHSPLDYKAHAVGDYLVNGTAPPASGYF